MIAALLGGISPGFVAVTAAGIALVLALGVRWVRGLCEPKAPTIAQVQAGEAVAKEQASIAQATATTVKDMAQAVTDAPTDQAAVVDSLNKGEF